MYESSRSVKQFEAGHSYHSGTPNIFGFYESLYKFLHVVVSVDFSIVPLSWSCPPFDLRPALLRRYFLFVFEKSHIQCNGIPNFYVFLFYRMNVLIQRSTEQHADIQMLDEYISSLLSYQLQHIQLMLNVQTNSDLLFK